VRELLFRDADGFCEVILPDIYREFLEIGDDFNKGLKNGLVGFRIPSTNYHSMLPLKVVGFYPAPKGSNANIVIAPSMLVYYHGSDFDADSLFVIKKDKFKGEKPVDLNDVIDYHKEDHTYNKDLILTPNKSVLGFNNEEAIEIGSQYLHQYLEGVTSIINKQIDAATVELGAKPKPSAVRTAELVGRLKTLNEHATILSDVIDGAAKNHIVNLFSTNMVDMKNRSDLLTPISFESVKGLRSKTKANLEKLLEGDESFFNDLKNAGLIQLKC